MKFTAIYVRRSVSDADKGNNSLSINAQKEECIRHLGEDKNYKIYCDDGKSGKDIEHRPAFMQMMQDARDGLISQIIVKKYDRFSRNMREYLNITDELDKYGVPVVSLSEPFNTATKEGRMMRNNLLNFAEFERLTIAGRVKDAYDTKARETGFYQGGKVYFGYESERKTVNGKTGSVLVPSPVAPTVAAMYDVYKQPTATLYDVVRHIQDNDLSIGEHRSGNMMDRSHISRLLASPLYVRADKNVYQYFLNKGYEMCDDVEAYDGIHGLLWHNENEKFVKVGYHEGIVDADTWLAVQDKKAGNKKIPHARGDFKTWLVGMTKCAHCGRAITLAYNINPKNGKEYRYYDCAGFKTVESCLKKRLIMRPDEVEALVFEKMQEHIKEFDIVKKDGGTRDSEAEGLRAEMLRIDTDMRKLIDRLVEADDVTFGYIQGRINELHTKKSELEDRLMMIERRVKKVDTAPLIDPLKRWDTLTNTEKHEVAMLMIDRITMSDETGIDIQFAF